LQGDELIKIERVAIPSSEDRKAILRGIDSFNETSLGFPRDYRPIALVLRQDGGISGGLWAGVWYSYLYVEALIVPESLRRQGIGRLILRQAEDEGQRLGCHASWLDTYSFQALGFYERQGYRVFGSLPDYPPGNTRYFLTKQLGNAASV
jgi:GNAT superfamily N-acetyltransferase